MFARYLPLQDLGKLQGLADEYTACYEYHGQKATYSRQNIELFRQLVLKGLNDHDPDQALALFKRIYDKEQMRFSASEQEILTGGIVKMEILFIKDEEYDELYEKCVSLFKGSNIAKAAFFNNIEIVDGKADKGLAIKEFCDLRGIREEEVAVAGDSLNDVGMFELFKNSYCVENGKMEARAAARHLCGKSYEDGVALLLEKIVEK